MNTALHRTLLAALVVLALSMTGAVAEEADTSRVESLAVNVGANTITVSGQGFFTGPTEQVAESFQEGGGPLPGTDIRTASITPVSQHFLEFEIEVADLLPVVGGTPEVVVYTWPMNVVKGNVSARYELAAHRTATTLEPLFGSLDNLGEPWFEVLEGPADDPTFIPLDGEFTDDTVRFFVPAGIIGASGGGATFDPAGPIQASVSAGGWGWFNGLGGKDMFWEPFTFHAPTVDLGIAPAGTPDEDVPTLTPASTLQIFTGAFSGSLPLPTQPGDYQVVAKACMGPDSCGTASQIVTVGS